MFSCTALGPALSVAIGLAHNMPGAAIVLATDGAANTGVGSGKDAVFYQKAALQAKQLGIAVNVLTMEGEDCAMEMIGLVSPSRSTALDFFDGGALRVAAGRLERRPSRHRQSARDEQGRRLAAGASRAGHR